LGRLYQQRLNLTEALALQQLQLEYLARLEAWEPMLDQVKAKVQLAELMPTAQAARTQGFLALAATKTGRDDLCQWLRQRAELLGGAETLVAERPVLAQLWPGVAPPAQADGSGGR